MILALARRNDAAPIADMSRRLIEDGLPWTWTAARVLRHIRHRETVVLTAREGQALAGFAIMNFAFESAHLNLLAVEPEHQRKGIGPAQLQWLEASAMTAGTFVIRLEVRARNAQALRFYRRLGYEEVGLASRYYCGIEDAIRMSRDLRASVPRNAT